MKYNLLGNTGLKVSELCMGTMTFGGKGRFQMIGNLAQAPVDEINEKSHRWRDQFYRHCQCIFRRAE